MPNKDDEQLARLLSRVEELCDRACDGQLSYTNFLTPRQAKHAMALLRARGQEGRARLYGGYACAERACLLLFPDYVIDAYEEEKEADVPNMLAYAGEDSPVVPVRIAASGYRTLTHRDYLGSLLALGIEREMLGDIAVDSDGAVVLCQARIKPFLLSHLERIGGDAVRILETTLPPDFDGGRTFVGVQDTVASPRLDCVVAALANYSRERAQTAVRNGEVEVDYECETRPDHMLEASAVLTIHGVGKFVLRELSERTRKGRIRWVADRYT